MSSYGSLDLYTGSPSLGLGTGLGNMGLTSSGGFLSGIGDAFSSFGNFMGSNAGQGLLGLGTGLANLYGMNKSIGIAEDQIDILEDQENRAATAQNFATGNSLAMALQMTTPGTAEHQRVQDAINNGTYQV